MADRIVTALLDAVSKSLDDLCNHPSLILVAISGGADSTALLHTLHSQGYKVHAANLNHGLRPEAVDDAKYVRTLCESFKVPYTLGQVDVAVEREERGGSIQEIARTVRYEFLERTADAVDADLIATGHTRDDRIETVLFNIIRGTGIDGLRGIPSRRGRIIRPLLDVSRAEVEAYCKEHALTPRHDSSNDSTKYSRNEIRLKLIPYLEERFNSKVSEAILRLSETASEDSSELDSIAREWLGGAQQLEWYRLSLLPLAVRRRVVRLWLKDVCGVEDLTFDHIESVLIDIPVKHSLTLPGNIRINYGNGYVRREIPEQSSNNGWGELRVPISVPGATMFCGWKVTAEGSLPCEIKPVLRFFKSGDRMRFPFGRRKVSDILSEAKLPIRERREIPLMIDAATGDVLAIANLKLTPLFPDLKFTAERIDHSRLNVSGSS